MSTGIVFEWSKRVSGMLVKFSGIDVMVEEELMKLCTYSGCAELNGWSWNRRILSCEQFVRFFSRYLGS